MPQPLKQPGKLTSILFLLVLAVAVGVAGTRDWTPANREVSPRPLLSQPAQPPITLSAKRAATLSDAFVGISEALTPAVVRIQAERSTPNPHASAPGLRGLFGGAQNGDQVPETIPETSGGSGFLVSPDGYILTNNHVIDGYERITVTLLDRRSFDATVVGHDPTTDVAVIRIDARDLPYMKLGNSDESRVGEWVLAIGNPGFSDASSTLDFTVTTGIISAKGRPLQIINTELQAEENPAASYAIEDFIQTDAVINPGNSGGPLVNLRGEVIGINTAIATGTGYYQGYGFAIPSNLAQKVMRDLVENGHVRRALLGISIADVSAEDAELYKLPRISGVRVDDFADDAPARRAGIQRQDVIVAIDGQPVDRIGQLQRLVAQHRPGESVRVSVIRFGEPHEFEIRLSEAPIEDEPATRRPLVREPAPKDLGLQLDDLTPMLARRQHLAGASGVVVTRVAPFSASARKGVQPGDRVEEVNGHAVRTAQEAEGYLRQLKHGQIASLLLRSPEDQTRIANIRVP